MATSINRREIEHFSKDSGEWWDEKGPFAPLHRLNPARMGYIRRQIGRHYGRGGDELRPFTGMKFLDIGCGGGLVCEPLARLGAKVTGIDADERAIGVAQDHANKSGLDIDYRTTSTEQMPKSAAKQFDAVLALEIVEHVDHVDEFVQSCVDLCKPGGIIIFSTLNRTPQSFALGIVAAERILGWVPPGTHQWKKFLRPSELSRMVRNAGAREHDISGLSYFPVKSEFAITGDVSVNYFLTAVKP